MAGIALLARRAGIKKEEADSVFTALVELLEEGHIVKVPHFGTFKALIKPPKNKPAPFADGGVTRVPRRRVLKYRMSRDLQQRWIMEKRTEEVTT